MSLFEGLTPEAIRSRVLERMGTNLQTREGSFSYDVVSPISFEQWRVLMTLEEFLSAFYVDENSGAYLDSHAALLGLERRQGAKATASVTFTGQDGVTVPAGLSFFTTTGFEFVLTEAVAIADGSATGLLEAAAIGAAYNVGACEINQIQRNISGVTSFVCEAADGGADAESDASLYARIVYRRLHPSTSGNESHYIEWALSCEGIGAVKVTRLWNGPGTVRVLVTGYDYLPVDDDLVAECAAYIETQRPAGADVTVCSAAATTINVTATVTTNGVITVEQVQEKFKVDLKEYLAEVTEEYFESREAFEYPVYYNRIAALLMSINGVVDYTNLRVNGATANVMVSNTSVPVVGEVTLQ